MLIVIVLLVVVICVGVFLFIKQPQFGQSPSGKRQTRIEQSPNYRDGTFQNIHNTPQLAEGYTLFGVIFNQIFKPAEHKRPIDVLPSIKTNLLELKPEENVLIWFGHSSYFMQIDGKRFLVDPVFCGYASPMSGFITAFDGTNEYSVEDIPSIDYLVISHDHYDHVDFESLIKLQPKTKHVLCGLGVGQHFEYWGYDKHQIIEKDWNETVDLGEGFTVVTAPARHFSGRGLTRNTTLWMSYVLQTPTLKIYIGGDSGYDTHFAEIGSKYGPIDLAILENGQYDERWKYIHLLPNEVLQATRDLHAKRVFPVHSSKFALANHAWNEPLAKITELNKTLNIPLLTPKIGEVVDLSNVNQQFEQWWVGLR